MSVRIERDGAVWTVVLDRPDVRNAVDTDHARSLLEAFEAFEADDTAAAAVLWGAGGTFCAGADLKAVAAGELRALPPGEGPPGMGPTRLVLTKPVVAAIDGFAVAGGLELALWCDLRVADPAATFGVFCRRWGVPLIDGGTVRLPRLIGHSRALDMILTGRAVGAEEALEFGLANRVSAPGRALDEAQALARQLAAFPQVCLRADRASSYEQFGSDLDAAIRNEWRHGETALRAEAAGGAAQFAAGAGRHGDGTTTATATAASAAARRARSASAEQGSRRRSARTTMSGMGLTPEDVRDKTFSTVRFKPGYDEEQVDEFLDEIVAELRRLHERISELESRQD